MERRDKLLSLEEVGSLTGAKKALLHFAADSSQEMLSMFSFADLSPENLSPCAAMVVDKLVHLLQKCSRLEGELHISNQTILSLLEQGADAKEIELAGGLLPSQLLNLLCLHTGQSCKAFLSML